jgi:hypothetical protein
VTVRKSDVAVVAPTVSIRRLRTEDVGVAVRVTGQTVLLDSVLGVTGPAAVQVGEGSLLARNVAVSGSGTAVSEGENTWKGPHLEELVVGSRVGLGTGSGASLRTLNLPVEESPELQYPAAEQWVVVGGRDDIAGALQDAIDSGAADIMVTGGKIERTVEVRGSVRRIMGAGVTVLGMNTAEVPAFRVVTGSSPVVIMELLYAAYGATSKVSIELDSPRTLVVRHGGINFDVSARGKGGRVFMESVVGSMTVRGVSAWLRDVDTEVGGLDAWNVVNEHSDLWILGHKTEDYGTKIRMKGGRTELLGGTYRQNWDDEDFAKFGITESNRPVLFDLTDGQFSATYVSWGPRNPFNVLVRQRAGGVVREVKRETSGGSATLFSTEYRDTGP